jgi:DHA1 family bicyclomycin/chloramphenicol resistance-like MFS transporter
MTISSNRGSAEFVALMAVMMSVVAISIDAMLPALGIISDDLGLTDPNQAQFIISSIFAGMAVGQLICGPLSDALGRKRVIYVTIVLYLIGSVVCVLAGSIETLLIGRFLQGLGVSGPYVSTMSIVRDKYSGSAMGRVMSLVMMIFIMVPAVAPSLGEAILSFASWRYIFGMFIVYALAVMVWVTIRLEETLPPEKRISFSIAHMVTGATAVFSHRRTVCYMVASALIFGGMTGYLNSSQQIFQEHFGVGKAFALYFGGLALTFGVSSLSNSRIVERLGMQRIVGIAFAAIVVCSAIFLGVNLLMPATLWMFVTYVACIFFCMGFLFGNLNALAMEPMGHIAGIASAIIGSTASVISICLGTLIGQLYNDTVIPMTIGFLVLGSLAVVLLSVARRA